MRMNMGDKAVLILLLMVTSIGCQKSADLPSDGDPFERSAQALEVYLGTNALEAEAAMLDFEKFLKRCEKTGNREIPFEEYYASTYSRLYRVQRALGKTNEANENYQKAEKYWLKDDERRGLPKLTAEELRDQIEGKHSNFSSPQWERAK